jgi:predicted nucleic acid-binding protein
VRSENPELRKDAAAPGPHAVNDGNGRERAATRIELQDRIVLETRRSQGGASAPVEQFEFEVVGIVEDPDSASQYAVCYSATADEFIVTDDTGDLLDDDPLAQEILKDFLDQANDNGDVST